MRIGDDVEVHFIGFANGRRARLRITAPPWVRIERDVPGRQSKPTPGGET